jgi:ribonuclease-3
MMTRNAVTLEKKIGYCFKNKTLLKQALTHRSFCVTHNERFEFLGDSVLNIVTTEMIYHRYPEASEGDLTRLRSRLVKSETLSMIAGEFNISDYIFMGAGELASGGLQRLVVWADTLEALIAAIYLDSDWATVKQIVLSWYQHHSVLLSLGTLEKDPKTQLQEYLQAKQLSLPVYTLMSQQGPVHDQIFHIRCVIPAMGLETESTGKTRRGAEQTAARLAFERIGEALGKSHDG